MSFKFYKLRQTSKVTARIYSNDYHMIQKNFNNAVRQRYTTKSTFSNLFVACTTREFHDNCSSYYVSKNNLTIPDYMCHTLYFIKSGSARNMSKFIFLIHKPPYNLYFFFHT